MADFGGRFTITQHSPRLYPLPLASQCLATLCDGFHNSPEGFGNKTVHTLDMAQMEREVLDWMYMDRPRRRPMRYNHLPAQERNAEIVRRRKNGESLTSLAREFGITVQRVWYIVMRGR